MTDDSGLSHRIPPARSARWLVAGGYAVLGAGFWIGGMLPTGRGEHIGSGPNTWAFGIVVGGALLLGGLVRGTQALLRERDRVRWFDIAVLGLGAAPFVLVAIGAALSR